MTADPSQLSDPELIAAWQAYGSECGDAETPESVAIAAEMARRELDF